MPIDELAIFEDAQAVQDEAFLEENDNEIHLPMILETESMLPPPRPDATSAYGDAPEPVPHKRADRPISDFALALDLWCFQSNITRRQYSGLLEVLRLLVDIDDLQQLPKDVSTLTKSAVAQLPLLPQRRKQVYLKPEKLPTLQPSQKFGDVSAPTTWVYWFDPAALFTAILSTPAITEKLHFGMAEFVDEPYEFWHSMSWASSIRSTSGEYAKYPDGSPVFPSDFVEYSCREPSCSCSTTVHSTVDM
jgi:hypothetical protein